MIDKRYRRETVGGDMFPVLEDLVESEKKLNKPKGADERMYRETQRDGRIVYRRYSP